MGLSEIVAWNFRPKLPAPTIHIDTFSFSVANLYIDVTVSKQLVVFMLCIYSNVLAFLTNLISIRRVIVQFPDTV